MLHVGVVRVPHLDRAPAAQVPLVGVGEVAQLVRVLEVERQRPQFAVDLEVVLVLAPARVAGGLEGGHRAAGEARQKGAGVVDFHRPAGAGFILQLALLDERLGGGGDAGDRSRQPHRGVDGVRQQIAGHAAAGHALVQPPQGVAALRHVRADGPVLQVARPVVEHAPDAALVDDLLGQGDGRHAPVVEPHHVRLAGGRHRRHQLPALRGIHRQRLFAGDHLAGRGRGLGDLQMHVVGGADVDQVDVGPLHHAAPVGVGLLPSPVGGERLELVRLARAGRLHHRLVLQVEEVAHLAVGVGMGAAHEAVADDGDVQFLLGHGFLPTASARGRAGTAPPPWRPPGRPD